MLFRARVPIFYWAGEPHRDNLIQKSQLYSGCYNCNQKLLGIPGKCDLVIGKKRNENALSYKEEPKSRIRKGVLTKAQENTAAPLSSKGANHHSRLATGLCNLCNIGYCTWSDSSAPANQTQPHLTESTLSFSAGCSPGPRYYSEKPYGSSTSTQMLCLSRKFSHYTH